MINTISKSKLGMKIIWCILLCRSSTLRKAKARIQGSNLEAGAKTKAMGEHSLLACFFGFAKYHSSLVQGHQHRDDIENNGLPFPTSANNQENAL